jgi:NAD(P)-dependent dehydrogenase (short-subunit alcohol dehydrogenase family)
MQIKGCVALVTGASRGLGRAFSAGLLKAGAAKVYAAARAPTRASLPGAQAITLDITNAAEVAGVAEQCSDVSLLINNAGVASFAPLLASASLDAARSEMETNYFGTLAMCRAFAPVLARNGGGAIVNVLSVVSWFNAPPQGSYCVSKAAEWSMTRGVRIEVRRQKTLVVGVYAGYIDTDMASHVAGPKTRPEDVVDATLRGIEAGLEEILADERARTVKAAMLLDPLALDDAMQQLWDERAKTVRS